MLRVYKHTFRSYGSEELLCPKCGFVIWTCKTEADVKQAIEMLDGGVCPERYGGMPKPIEKYLLEKLSL